MQTSAAPVLNVKIIYNKLTSKFSSKKKIPKVTAIRQVKKIALLLNLTVSKKTKTRSHQ